MTHKTIKVKVGDWEAKIDKMLAPLIKEMWRAGIETEECCEDFWNDEQKLAFIYFPRVEELKRLVDLVANGADWKNPKSLYRRINPPYGYDEQIPAWTYNLAVEDMLIGSGTGVNHVMQAALWFHQSDIPLCTAILKAHNDRFKRRTPSSST